MNHPYNLYRLITFPRRAGQRIKTALQKRLLRKCGTDVRFGSNVDIIWGNCSIGNDVYIGKNAMFICADAPLEIGDHVMFGPNCTIITGDHRIDIVGKYISQVTVADKKPENDLPVKLEGDNWVGANSVILKGVTIGFGAVIAAGAVVTQNVPAYSIVGGVPAKIISMRFSDAEIREHEEKLQINCGR